MQHITLIVGACPNFMKIASLIHLIYNLQEQA